jgi:hypothetical protein
MVRTAAKSAHALVSGDSCSELSIVPRSTEPVDCLAKGVGDEFCHSADTSYRTMS